MIRLIRYMLAIAITAVSAPGAQAAYPDQPVTMIVPFPAGGGADADVRLLARHL